MKLPNFRLYSTQATIGLVLALAAGASSVVLAYCVFRGLNTHDMEVRYNEREGLGQYRNYAVMFLAGGVLLLGAAAAGLGYNSIGQKRNNFPGRSWIGLGLGALATALAPVLLYAWRTLRVPL